MGCNVFSAGRQMGRCFCSSWHCRVTAECSSGRGNVSILLIAGHSQPSSGLVPSSCLSILVDYFTA